VPVNRLIKTLARAVPLVLLAAALQVVALATTPAYAASTAPLSGTVTDTDANPVGGAQVFLIPLAGREPVASVTADASGAYEFLTAPTDPVGYLVMARSPQADPKAPAMGAAGGLYKPKATPVVRNVQLPPSNVRGTVTASDGTPSAGAVVRQFESSYPWALTYPDGTYRAWLQPETYTATAVPSVAAPTLDAARTKEAVVPETGVLTLDFALSQPTVRGVVRAPGGGPVVAGAQVQLKPAAGGVADVAISRSDGSFGFAPAPGSYVLTAQPPDPNANLWTDGKTATFDVTATNTPLTKDVELSNATVTGTVRSADGTPLNRAQVVFVSHADFVASTTRTNSAGQYAFNLPPGTYGVGAYSSRSHAEDLDLYRTVTVEALPKVVDLTLAKPNVVGTVVTADGLPVANAYVNAYGPDVGSGDDLVASAYTDDDGVFGLRIAAGAQRLVIRPPDWAFDAERSFFDITVPATGALSRTFTMDRPAAPTYATRPVEIQTGGAPAVRVLDSVLSADGSQVMALATDGSLCTEGCSGADGWVLHNLATGDDKPLLDSSGQPVRFQYAARPALSATGRYAAFSTQQPGVVAGDTEWGWDGFVFDQQNGNIWRIKPDPAASDDNAPPDLGPRPALSADGSVFAVVQRRYPASGGTLSQILVVTGAGGVESSRRVITVGSRTETPQFALSADGSTLAWLELVEDSPPWRLHVLNLATGVEDPVRTLPGDTFEAPSLSSNGNIIAFGVVDDVTNFRTVHVLNRTTGADVVPDFLQPVPGNSGALDFTLAGDGSHLFTQADGPKAGESDRQLWRLNLADNSHVLVNALPNGRRDLDHQPQNFSITADGQRASWRIEDNPTSELVVGDADKTAPTWPSGAALAAEPGVTDARLTWPAATDNVAVAGYHVYQGSTLVGSTSNRQLRVTGLTADTDYHFKVEAVDAVGNESTTGPTVDTRTLDDTTTTLRTLDLTTSGGGVISGNWEAASGADAMVVRTFLGETLVEEQTLSATATSFRAAGLAANTTFTVQVFKKTGSTVAPYTQIGTVKTAALSLAAVSMTPADRVSGNTARYGTAIDLAATAEPGREVTATVTYRSWYDDAHHLLDAPREMTSVVPLSEHGEGSYRGAFNLVDGVAGVDQVKATVSDGHGTTLDRTSGSPALQVSAKATVTVGAAGSLVGGTVNVGSVTTSQYATQATNGGEAAIFDGFSGADDYVVTAYDSSRRVAAKDSAIALRGGLVSDVVVALRAPASLSVIAKKPGGQAAQGSLAVYDSSNDEFRAGGALGALPMTVSGLRAGDQLRLEPTYDPDDLLVTAARTVTLTAGANSIDLAPANLPRTTVSGTVTDSAGDAADGLVVSLDQARPGGGSHTFTDTTDAAGRYQISGLLRRGRVRVTEGWGSARADVDLTDGPATADLQLDGPIPYRIHFSLFTQTGSTPEVGPIVMDWRTAVHYGARATLDGVSAMASSQVTDGAGASVINVYGRPGQTYEWCLTSYEPQLVPTCASVVLPVSHDVDLAVHAVGAKAITMPVQDASGAAVGGISWTLSRHQSDGWDVVSRRNGWASVEDLATSPGDYELLVTSGSLSGRRSFTVAPSDDAITLQPMLLAALPHFGGVDNVVTAPVLSAPPRGNVEFRATWRNQGSALTGVTARIAVPAGTTLDPDSILLDGRPVVATTRDGFVDVAVGAVPTDGTGTLRYWLRLSPEAIGAIAGRVDIRSGSTTEPLSPASVEVSGVTISGPAAVNSNRVRLNGRAPAGNTVVIADAGAEIGRTVAGAGGFWSVVVTPPERAELGAEHQLSASTTVAGETYFAAHSVTIDDSYPVPSGGTITQFDRELPTGRTASWDTQDGLASFPFVYVPGQPMSVTQNFTHPELVSNTVVRIGDNAGFASGAGWAVGPISVEYDADRVPMRLDLSSPTRAAVAGTLAPQLTGYTTSNVSDFAPDGSGGQVASYDLRLPSAGGANVRATFLTQQVEGFTPSAADLAAQRKSGAPIWGLDARIGTSDITYTWLMPATATGSRTPSAAGDTVVRASIKLAFDGASNLDSVLSAFGSGEKYEKLGDLLDAYDCGPASGGNFTNRARAIANQAAAFDVLGAAMTVGGLFLGPLGAIALGVTAWAIDKASGQHIDAMTEQLRHDMDVNPDCKKREQPERKRQPVATPKWIYDPSGYAFEGARTQRLEGVTATLLQGDTADGPWHVWNAEEYDQVNPQITDGRGRYGWDVPEGWWQVAFTKDGYETSRSRVLRVLPPHLDVDVPMVRTALAEVTSAELADGGVEVTFDRLMRADSFASGISLTASGNRIPGNWTPLGEATSEAGDDLASGARFVPSSTFAASAVLRLVVDGVTDYAARPMAAPYAANLNVTGETAQVPAAPTDVKAVAGEHSATVSWTPPSDNGAPLTRYLITQVGSGRTIAVTAPATSAQVKDLAGGVPVSFTVTAYNGVGAGPASAATASVTPTAIGPETTLIKPPSGVVARTSLPMRWRAEGAVSYACQLDGSATPCLSRLKPRPGTHTFSVAGIDAEGDRDATPATTTWTTPLGAKRLQRASGWTLARKRWAYAGRVATASRRGATLSTKVQRAGQVAVVATVGPRQGKVAVYLGKKKIGTVSLASKKSRHSQVKMLPRLKRPVTGKVRIVVVTAGRAVAIEGFAVVTHAMPTGGAPSLW
jgi:hypothetical protein